MLTLNFTRPMKRRVHPWEDRYYVLQVNAVECNQKNMIVPLFFFNYQYTNSETANP